MLTLGDIANEILKIREAIDAVEVKGQDNRTRLSYAYKICENLIEKINETAREIQNQVQEAGDESGEQDSGAAE